MKYEKDSKYEKEPHSKYDYHHHYPREVNKSSTTSPLVKYHKHSGNVFKENRPHKY